MSATKISFGDWLHANGIHSVFSFSFVNDSRNDLVHVGRPFPELPRMIFGMAKKPLGMVKYSTILVTREELEELAKMLSALSIQSSKPLTTKAKTVVSPLNFEGRHQRMAHLKARKQVFRHTTAKPFLIRTGATVLSSKRNVPRPFPNNSKPFHKNTAQEKKDKPADGTREKSFKKNNATTKKPPACFTLLPIELRLIIWNFSRPEPRAVKISMSKHQETRTQNLYSGALIPNLLHVSRESREVALKWYKLSFGKRKTIYFDWSNDYLYVQCLECRGRMCYDTSSETCGLIRLDDVERDSLKRLIWEFSGNSTSVEIIALMRYPTVNELKIIHWENGLRFRHGAELSQFVEDKHKYLWQNNKSLLDFFKSSNFANDQDHHGEAIRNLKSAEHIALYPSNSLADVLKDTEMPSLKQK